MNRNLFNMSFLTYFFAGWLILGLLIMITGVNITFWHTYEFSNDVFQYDISWYSIKRFDNNFWDTFRTLNNLYHLSGYNPFKSIPNIPMIPYFSNTNFGLIVVDVLIGIVNGLSTLINVIISLFNSIREIIITVSAFINTLAVWVANSGSSAHEVIYTIYG